MKRHADGTSAAPRRSALRALKPRAAVENVPHRPLPSPDLAPPPLAAGTHAKSRVRSRGQQMLAQAHPAGIAPPLRSFSKEEPSPAASAAASATPAPAPAAPPSASPAATAASLPPSTAAAPPSASPAATAASLPPSTAAAPPPSSPDADASSPAAAVHAASVAALPAAYRLLLETYVQVETTLSFFSARGELSLFSKLRAPVEQALPATRRAFTPPLLEQLLGVWPGGLRVSLVSVAPRADEAEGSRAWDWLLELPPPPAAAPRTHRRRQFAARLVAAAARGEAPHAPLPPLPPPAAPPAAANRWLRQAAEAEAAEAAAEAEAEAEGRGVPAGCEGLSSALIAKVQRKQLEQVVAAERRPAAVRARRLRQMAQLATTIRSTMRTEKGGKGESTVMALEELLERLRRDERHCFSVSELEVMQQMLAELVPQWFSCVSSSGHTLARIDNTVPFAGVLETLKQQAAAAAGQLSSA